MTASQLSGKNEVHPRTPGPRLTHQLSADVWVRHAKMGQAWPRSSEPPSIPIDISVSHSVMSDSLQPHGLYISLMHAILQARILEWVAISFFQGIFPTQGLNPGLPHCRRILYQLSYKGSPRTLEWVAYPFFSLSSWPRNWTGVSCIAGRFFTNWAIREALIASLGLQSWTQLSDWAQSVNCVQLCMLTCFLPSPTPHPKSWLKPLQSSSCVP